MKNKAVIFYILINSFFFINAFTQFVSKEHRATLGQLSKYLNEKKWNELFPHRSGFTKTAKQNDFYSFQAFQQAAKYFPTFLAEGNEETQKRELAAFLANIALETSGGWKDAPDGYYKWGLYFLDEKGCEMGCYQYSDTGKKKYAPVKNISYHGRGPIQLSWNYNYGQFSELYFGNKDTLLLHPQILTENAIVSFASAIWFWTTAQLPKPSCHDIICNKWQPTAADSAANRLPGFGAIINVINGGVECGNKQNEKTTYRYNYYLYFCKYFKVNPGNNVTCSSQKPFGT